MNPVSYRVRRATLEDVGHLTSLWGTMGFPVEGLSKRMTEFQVAVGPNDELLGAVGLQVAERQGRVHTESFFDFSLADQLRPLLWERVLAVANNVGLIRLWTTEKAPFWRQLDFNPPDEAALQKLPAAWRAQEGLWLTLKLREDVEALTSMDAQFALFMQAERQRTERTLQQAKILKGIAMLVAIAAAILALGAVGYMLMKNPRMLSR